MRRRLMLVLATLAVVGSGVAAVLGGVLAYESHIINVEANVANALSVPNFFDLGDPFGTLPPTTSTPENFLFPQQFVVGSVVFGMSDEFEANASVSSMTVDVWVHCKPAEFTSGGGGWMGDATYMSLNPSAGSLDPGPNSSSTPPTAPLTSVSNGWTFIGGDPNACPGGPTPGNLLQVFSSGTAIVLDKLALPGSGQAEIFLGLDVPICGKNYNPDTDPVPTEAGWGKPTLIIGSGDPRFDGDINCHQRLGLDLKIQVVQIQTTP